MGFRRGWEVEYENGNIFREDSYHWNKIPKINITRLTLRYDGREWNISGKEAYLQKKRGSMIPGVKESFVVESRSIGYYEGNKKIWYTVNESTGRMSMTVEEN
jgi:hypothetical protein